MSRVVLLVASVVGFAATGCSTMNNTEKGVGIGGALGTATGLAVGAATGNPKTGALVGGLAGAGIGGLVGNDIDRKDEKERAVQQAQATAAATAQTIGFTDVVRMTQQNVDADVICEQIRSTGSTFTLTTSDIEYLTQIQASPKVIRAMQTARPRTAVVPVRERVIYRDPPPYYGPPPVYVVEQPPPIVGFHYRRGW